jgi:hypothetical protein
LKKENRGIIPGGAMVTGGVCSMYFQHYIIVISLVQKGIDYSEEDQRHSIGGAAPRKVQAGGAAPRGKWPFAIDVKGGEIVTLM